MVYGVFAMHEFFGINDFATVCVLCLASRRRVWYGCLGLSMLADTEELVSGAAGSRDECQACVLASFR